jgi:hypothetical protein
LQAFSYHRASFVTPTGAAARAGRAGGISDRTGASDHDGRLKPRARARLGAGDDAIKIAGSLEVGQHLVDQVNRVMCVCGVRDGRGDQVRL